MVEVRQQLGMKVCGGWLGGHAETELDGGSDLRKSDGGPSTHAEVASNDDGVRLETEPRFGMRRIERAKHP